MALRLHGITFADAQSQVARATRPPAREPAPGTWSGTLLVPFRDLCAVVSEQKSSRSTRPPGRRRAPSRGRRLDVPAGFGAARAGRRGLSRAGHPQALDGAALRVADRCAGIRRRSRASRACTSCGPTASRTRSRSGLGSRRRGGRGVSRAAPPRRRRRAAASREGHGSRAERRVPRRARPVEGVHRAPSTSSSDAHHLLTFDVTGPWAPYDFVRMQFGALTRVLS